MSSACSSGWDNQHASKQLGWFHGSVQPPAALAQQHAATAQQRQLQRVGGAATALHLDQHQEVASEGLGTMWAPVIYHLAGKQNKV